MIEELELRVGRLFPAFRRLLDAGAFGFLEFAEPGDRSLTRPPLSSVRLHQSPVCLAFSFDFSVAWPDEHARIIDNKTAASNTEVSTTTRFATIKPA